MDPLIGAALITSGTNIAGNLLNTFGSQGGMSDTQKNDQRFMNDFAWKAALRNEEYQRNYMQIRAMDAQRAGLHPLAALGVNVGSGPASAAFVGSGEGSGRRYNAANAAADSIQGLGQNLSRAIAAQQTADERLITQATLAEKAANTDYIQAMADESRKRTAAIGSIPPVPNPYNQHMQGDVSQIPYADVVYRGRDGYETVMDPRFAMGLSADPLRMYIRSLGKIFRRDGSTKTDPDSAYMYRTGKRRK